MWRRVSLGTYVWVLSSTGCRGRSDSEGDNGGVKAVVRRSAYRSVGDGISGRLLRESWKRSGGYSAPLLTFIESCNGRPRTRGSSTSQCFRCTGP